MNSGWNALKKSVKKEQNKTQNQTNTEVSTRKHNVIEVMVAFIST